MTARTKGVPHEHGVGKLASLTAAPISWIDLLGSSDPVSKAALEATSPTNPTLNGKPLKVRAATSDLSSASMKAEQHNTSRMGERTSDWTYLVLQAPGPRL